MFTVASHLHLNPHDLDTQMHATLAVASVQSVLLPIAGLFFVVSLMHVAGEK